MHNVRFVAGVQPEAFFFLTRNKKSTSSMRPVIIYFKVNHYFAVVGIEGG